MDNYNNENNTQFKTACGGNLKDPTNYPKAVYRGTDVYFCTLACLRAFEEDPDPFMAGDMKHPIQKGAK